MSEAHMYDGHIYEHMRHVKCDGALARRRRELTPIDSRVAGSKADQPVKKGRGGLWASFRRGGNSCALPGKTVVDAKRAMSLQGPPMLWVSQSIRQAGQCPLTALAQAEYPTPSRKGRRSARTASISASLSLGDMAAITFVVGIYRGVCERQKSSKSRNDTATSMEVVVKLFSPAFSNRSASTASLDASVPGTGGASMPIRRIARRRGPLGESSAAKSQTHAAIRPPGRATRRISDIARALLGTKFMTSADATTSKDASGNGNSCASARRNSAFVRATRLRARAICDSDGSIAITDAGAHESEISSVNIPVPQPTSSQCAPSGGCNQARKALPISRLQRPMNCS